jgi:hypothetical protein
VVEKIIRESIEGKITAPKPQQALPEANTIPQVARPKAQAQLNNLAQSTANTGKVASTLIKAVTGGASGSTESASMQVQQTSGEENPTPKRKRTRRGGKKNKKRTLQDHQPQQSQPGPIEIKPHTVQVPQTPSQQHLPNDEQVINLR